MSRKNLKVPESLFLALRDDKPDHMSWPTYLETRCLGDGGVSQAYPDELSEQLDRIESAATAAESNTGSIQNALEREGIGR